MTVFCIATKIAGPHEHGGSPDEWVIKRTGGYVPGPFPPVFVNRELAQAYLEGMEWNFNSRVVELEFRT